MEYSDFKEHQSTLLHEIDHYLKWKSVAYKLLQPSFYCLPLRRYWTELAENLAKKVHVFRWCMDVASFVLVLTWGVHMLTCGELVLGCCVLYFELLNHPLVGRKYRGSTWTSRKYCAGTWTISSIATSLVIQMVQWLSPTSKPDINIKEFIESLTIPTSQSEICIRIVDNVVYFLEAELKAQREFPFLKVLDCEVSGSASEGLKVCKADEFDVLVHSYIGDESGTYLIDTVSSQDDYTIPSGWLRYDVRSGRNSMTLPEHLVISAGAYAGTSAVRKSLKPLVLLEAIFRPLLEKAVEKYNSYLARMNSEKGMVYGLLRGNRDLNIKLTTQGPALTLVIEIPPSGYLGSYTEPLPFQSLCIDMVPTLPLYSARCPRSIQLPQPLFAVAKTFEDKKSGRTDELLWRKSFSVYERKFLAKVQEKMGEGNCVHQVLSVAKGIREMDLNSDLKKNFCSYFLKTCLFHLCLKIPDPSDWAMQHLLQRLKDFNRLLIEFLDRKFLPHFFIANPGLVDYFPPDDFSSASIRGEQVVNLLENIQPDVIINVKKDLVNFCTKQGWI